MIGKAFQKGLISKWPFNGKPASVRQEISDLIETSSDGKASFDTHERTLLRNILGLRDITAEDVMVPRADIVAVDIAEGFESLTRQFTSANHSRMPAYEGRMDDIKGMVHIKDVLPHLVNGTAVEMDSILRPVLFVSPAIRAIDLLHEMRLRRQHLALVVDEFGGVDGLITIEDLVEEIVGEIEDEHDETSLPRYELTDDGSLIADARLEVEALEITHGTLISEDERNEIDTLGGLVFALAGRVPTCGEVIRHPSGVEFEILEGDPRRVTLIQVRGSDLVVPVPSHSER